MRLAQHPKQRLHQAAGLVCTRSVAFVGSVGDFSTPRN
jgi:hypothetical protein